MIFKIEVNRLTDDYFEVLNESYYKQLSVYYF